MLLGICSACKKSDNSIIKAFTDNRVALTRIAELAREDGAKELLHEFIFQTSHRSEHPKISEEHWGEYQRLLSQIGAIGVAASDHRVALRMQYIGEFDKGLVFTLEPPSPLLLSLDGFAPSEMCRTTDHGDYLGYRQIEGNWYIYAHYF